VFSLTPGFVGQVSESLWLSKDDQHPNEKGHQVAADALYPYVKNVVVTR
jgi:lysophospholipase L1-like esterase